MNESCVDIVKKAQDGDTAARELLIEQNTNFIIKAASRSCFRYIDRNNDDELSIAMMAFNEAIESYDHKQPAGFHGHARLVIQRRLIDHFRKEKKHRHSSLESEENVLLESGTSFGEYIKEQQSRERKSEIGILASELDTFKISFDLLEGKSPKHRETREKLFQAAQILAGNESFLQYLYKEKKLPQKELSRKAGCSVKVLERGRRYIISIALILSHPELVYLRSYISATRAAERSEENE